MAGGEPVSSKKSRRTFASRLNSLIAPFAPSLALRREAALVRREVLLGSGHYDGAGRGQRGKDFRKNRTDAVEALRADREPLSYIARDMLRNNPRVVRIKRLLRNNIVGAGIKPSVRWSGDPDDPRKSQVEALIKDHCLKRNFDADGVLTMLGQQSLALGTIVGDGEVLLRRRFRRPGDGFPLNFQVQVLETDFLNRNIDGKLANGNHAVEGIEFTPIGQRVAYHLYQSHPGGRHGALPASTRVDARNVIHAFDMARPGQHRGVSWFAPVIPLLHDLQRYQDGQVKRQEIAALFAGILQTGTETEEIEGALEDLKAGSIMTVGQDESLTFTNPPAVEGYEPFMRATDRVIAAAMGVTYEALAGDYTGVNYTSGRMGRMDVDPNIKDWQDNLMVAQICDTFAAWIAEGIEDVADIPRDLWQMIWTPPVRPMVDPTKDYKANETAMRSGQKSRRQVIRESGGDPDKVDQEIKEERDWAAENDLVFSGDSGSGAKDAGKKGESE